ncbi:MAG TPA: GH3 auxin-responsive promoter family protein, partial [Thermoanaerobaculia bacterium]|nr:GH3 auxin-responsive promoter family protein [Thermoanaerobaculia bacterium]
LEVVRRNARTPFGVAHDFASIRSVHDYQQRVPVRSYDELTAAFAPEARVASRIEHFEPTSGSSGATKRIPYTRELRNEFARAIAPWVCSLAASDPRAFTGRAYWALSPAATGGFETDDQYLGRVRGAFVRATQAVPSSVRKITDIETWRRVTLEHLVACRSLSFISVWHPTFLTMLVGPIRDTAATWPNLRVISCWTDAGCANAAAELARRFPHARVEPKGLLSTEGFVSIPFEGANLLAYRSHFIELHETDRAGRFEVVLTTASGLYRYATDDLVDVIGYRERCPILRFAGRKSHVSDHFGEKLHEVFVRESIDRALRDLGITARYASLAFDDTRYVLRIDTDAPLDNIASRVDALLRESFHYDYCRRLGQLGALGIVRAREDLTATHQRIGDVKPSALSHEALAR